jgi:hypothetical protein
VHEFTRGGPKPYNAADVGNHRVTCGQITVMLYIRTVPFLLQLHGVSRPVAPISILTRRRDDLASNY